MTIYDDSERQHFIEQFGDEANFQEEESVQDWLIRVEELDSETVGHTFYKLQVVWNALNSARK